MQLNWVVAYSSSDAGNSDMGEPFDNYVVALYWSVMTMSTIGYGDVSPKTRYERIYEIFGMILGASVYAYMVGAICSIVASMNAVSAEFNQQMDRWACVSFSWSSLYIIADTVVRQPQDQERTCLSLCMCDKSLNSL